MAGEKDPGESKSSADKVGPDRRKQTADSSAVADSRTDSEKARREKARVEWEAMNYRAPFDLPEGEEYHDLRPLDFANIIDNWTDGFIALYHEGVASNCSRTVQNLLSKHRFEHNTNLIRLALEHRGISSQPLDDLFEFFDTFTAGSELDSDEWRNLSKNALSAINRLKAKLSPENAARIREIGEKGGQQQSSPKKEEREFPKDEEEEVIEIREEDFNRSKSFTLLKKVINDKDRKGVKCEYRLRHSLADNLRTPQHKEKYGEVANSLIYRGGKLRITIAPDNIIIIYKEHKK
ncbi:MAG: hypothetical protein KAT11_00075 [Phycisphaerae bacterium]|nr:hypothetical protein [Phycisphaerae bacterium]